MLILEAKTLREKSVEIAPSFHPLRPLLHQYGPGPRKRWPSGPALRQGFVYTLDECGLIATPNPLQFVHRRGSLRYNTLGKGGGDHYKYWARFQQRNNTHFFSINVVVWSTVRAQNSPSMWG